MVWKYSFKGFYLVFRYGMVLFLSMLFQLFFQEGGVNYRMGLQILNFVFLIFYLIGGLYWYFGFLEIDSSLEL